MFLGKGCVGAVAEPRVVVFLVGLGLGADPANDGVNAANAWTRWHNRLTVGRRHEDDSGGSPRNVYLGAAQAGAWGLLSRFRPGARHVGVGDAAG
jgi:hypothetical protein